MLAVTSGVSVSMLKRFAHRFIYFFLRETWAPNFSWTHTGPGSIRVSMVKSEDVSTIFDVFFKFGVVRHRQQTVLNQVYAAATSYSTTFSWGFGRLQAIYGCNTATNWCGVGLSLLIVNSSNPLRHGHNAQKSGLSRGNWDFWSPNLHQYCLYSLLYSGNKSCEEMSCFVEVCFFQVLLYIIWCSRFLIMTLRFYCEGAALWVSGTVLAAWGAVTQVWSSPEPPLLQQRCAAWTASAWLEPQRLHERSLRLPPPGTFPGFQRLQIRLHSQCTYTRASWAHLLDPTKFTFVNLTSRSVLLHHLTYPGQFNMLLC